MTLRTLDGAMGTELIRRGLQNGEPSALWCLERPEDVESVHRAYLAAGSEAITTNTFGANVHQLALHGLQDRLEAINAAAVARARAAGAPFVLGDIGPSGQTLEPYGDLEPEALADAVARQGRVLAEEGVDAFLVETFSDPGELEVAVGALLPFGKPIYATFAYESSLRTAWGTEPEEAVARAISAGAAAVGANCGTALGLAQYAELGQRLIASSQGRPVILQPNAGAPRRTEDGYSYDLDAEAFGTWAATMRGLGPVILGGCCGTTPAHVAAIAA